MSRGLLEYLQSFDIIMLSETRRHVLDKDLWTQFKVFFHPASNLGRAGEGILLAIRYRPEYHIVPYSTKRGSLWAKVQFRGGGPPLIIGTTYIPPSGSPLLSSLSLNKRMNDIQATFGKALAEGFVFLGGDLNSRVGPLPPMTPGVDPQVNSHGRHLLRVVHKIGAYMCTGRVTGDIPARASFHGTRRSIATRLDHIIVSPSLLTHLVECQVDGERSDSDHFPLCTALSLPICLEERTPCDHGGTPLSQIVWSPAARDAYVRALQYDHSGFMSQCQQAIQTGDFQSSIRSLYAFVEGAAKESGMLKRSKRDHHQVNRHQPFFDTECKTLKRELWRYGRRVKWRGADFKKLEREYHARVRSKKRVFETQKLKCVINQKKSNPQKFWKTLRRDRDRLPNSLLDVSAWEPYMQSLARGPENGESPRIPPSEAYPPHEPPQDQCSELNSPFTVEEIDLGLRALANGKSPGILGFPAELFRYAQASSTPGEPYTPNVLSPLIADIFTLALANRMVPAEANACLVTPVHKKGDAYDTANYRPIAVGDSLMRLYANILNSRLVAYLENNRLRVDCQTGFRPELSTTHQLFIVQHLIDWARGVTPLHFAFLDLSKAYDRVSRFQLGIILEQLGIKGDFLHAVQAVINTTMLAVKIESRHGDLFESTSGVPQGCPLSPTVFGVMADGLPRYLAHHCPGVGITISDGTCVNLVRIPVLGYADDFALVAPTIEDLQCLVDATHAWCQIMDMRLNGAKTQYLYVNPNPQILGPPIPLRCAGVTVNAIDQAKYLGLQIHARKGLQASIQTLEQRFWMSWENLNRAYSNLGCNISMMLMVELYLACLPPLFSYGCEVWAFRCFKGKHVDSGRPSSTPLLEAHRRVLAQILGVRRTTPEGIINCELNIYSMHSSWLLRMVRFWNNIAAMRPDAVHHKVLLQDLRLAIVDGRETFAGTLMQQLKKLGYYIADHVRLNAVRSIDISEVKSLLDRQTDSLWDGLDDYPRSCVSNRALFCRYHRWFARPPHVPSHRSALKLQVSNRTLQAFMRFRLGCHNLPVDSGRQLGIPRAQRICTRCSLELVGDEHHLLFTCPAVQHVREQFMRLFQYKTRSVQTFMWQNDSEGVARFVVKALESYITLPGAVRP